jgi:trigger factor
MFADVRRGLAVAAVVHGATVTDTDGNVIDTDEFFGPPATTDAAEAAAQIAAQVQAAAAGNADAEPAEPADADAETDNAETDPVDDEASDDTK